MRRNLTTAEQWWIRRACTNVQPRQSLLPADSNLNIFEARRLRQACNGPNDLYSLARAFAAHINEREKGKVGRNRIFKQMRFSLVYTNAQTRLSFRCSRKWDKNWKTWYLLHCSSLNPSWRIVLSGISHSPIRAFLALTKIYTSQVLPFSTTFLFGKNWNSLDIVSNPVYTGPKTLLMPQ